MPEILPEVDEILRTNGTSQEIINASAVYAAQIAMAKKLYEKSKRDHSGGWWNPEECTVNQLRESLKEHVEKGDMVDVMNIAMFIYIRETYQEALAERLGW